MPHTRRAVLRAGYLAAAAAVAVAVVIVVVVSVQRLQQETFMPRMH